MNPNVNEVALKDYKYLFTLTYGVQKQGYITNAKKTYKTKNGKDSIKASLPF